MVKAKDQKEFKKQYFKLWFLIFHYFSKYKRLNLHFVEFFMIIYSKIGKIILSIWLDVIEKFHAFVARLLAFHCGILLMKQYCGRWEENINVEEGKQAESIAILNYCNIVSLYLRQLHLASPTVSVSEIFCSNHIFVRLVSPDFRATSTILEDNNRVKLPFVSLYASRISGTITVP